MKYLLLITTIFAFSLLQAQDAETENYEYPEDYNEDEHDGYDDYDYEYEEYTPAHHQVPPDQLRSTHHYKEKKIAVNKFDIKKWREVTGGIDYAEEREDTSLSIPDSTPWQSDILKRIAYVAIVIIVIVILYVVYRNISINARADKKKVVSAADPSADVEDISELDIQALLMEAIAQNNFRLAVRLYYLGLLKNLDEARFIQWKKDKTNREYLSELSQHDCYQDARKLTLAYERVWYGEYQVSEMSFRELADAFKDIGQRIKQTAQ